MAHGLDLTDFGSTFDDGSALDDLFTVTYEELRRLAAAVRRGDPSATLSPTALVNEAWLKLRESPHIARTTPVHFKRIAARAMRQVLIEAARRRQADKRGGGAAVVTFDESLHEPASSTDDLIALDDALDALARIQPRQATLVESRFFAGLEVAEIAACCRYQSPRSCATGGPRAHGSPTKCATTAGAGRVSGPRSDIHCRSRTAPRHSDGGVTMDATRWERVQRLFHAVADMAPHEQSEFLAAECIDDPSLVAETFALLAADARGNDLIDDGVARAAGRVFARADEQPVPVERFGQYRITRVLGEGGMGVVYLAQRDDLDSVAAVKILRDAWLSPSRRERFASEQRTLAQLNHPLIARLYDANTLPDGTPWFVMEYVEGVPLTEYCATHATSLPGRLHLLRDVCEAVQHAHRQLVIHRDLKPSNILVRGDGTVKLLDFGIAKQLESVDSVADQTRTGLRLMTPAYAAPEQVRGGRVGTYTDVYALGVILYELITGRLPFAASDELSDDLEVIRPDREPERPSVVARQTQILPHADIPGSTPSKSEWADLDVLCLKAMHHDPQRRYATVDALIRDIDHYLSGEPLEARPDSARYRLGKFARRNREAVLATTIAAALVVALVSFYTGRLARARTDALSEAARAQRIQGFTLGLFQGDDKDAGPADTMRVVALVDRGVANARALDAEPAAQADLYLTLGGIYQKLGRFDRADSLTRLALDRRRSLSGPINPDVADALVALGLVRIDEAKLDDAERLIRQGLDVARRTLPPAAPTVIKATAALGRVLQERGAYAQAIPLLDDVVRLNEAAHAAPTQIGASLSALADAHYYAGHYPVSDSLNTRVLAIYREAYGERHPLVAQILMNLGASQFDRGNYVPAEQLERRALQINEAFYGPNHYKTAENLTMLARALVFEDRFDDAVGLLNRALAIRERVYGPVNPNVASTVNELGNIAFQRDHFDEAERDFRRMLDIYRAIYGEKHYLIGVATSNLASTYLGRKDYPRAEQAFRDAVRVLSETQGPEHLNTAIARIKLGRTLLRERKFAGARDESLAGYQILVKQANPAISFITAAKKDLTAEFDSLGQPEQAARFRVPVAQSR